MKQATAILWAACLGYGMVILDTSALNVALPSIAAETGASGGQARWIIDAYVLVMTALLLAGGGLIDRFGARRIFYAGIAIFAVASLACATSFSAPALIAARAAQGVGGALLIPATLTIIITSFSEPQARGRAIAIIATVTASPQAFGPTLGGVLVDTLGWRSVFLLNLPIAVATLWLARRIPTSSPHRRPLDYAGIVLVALTLGALTYAVIDFTTAWQWTLHATVAIAVSVLSFVLFLVTERVVASPLLPSEVLRAPVVHLYVFAGTFMFILFYGALFAANLFMQNVHHLSALASGLLLLPAGIPVFVLPILVSRFIRNVAPFALTVIGVTISTLGSAIALLTLAYDSLVTIAISLLIVGIGFGIASPPHLNLATAVAPAGTTGVISALANAGRQAGYLFGVAAVGVAGASLIGYAQAVAIATGAGIIALLLLSAARGRSRVPD